MSNPSNGDSGWRPMTDVVGNDEFAAGKVDMVTGVEKRPCMMCKSWEKDEIKLLRHFATYGLTPDPNGIITTPIAKDFPGRQSLKIKVKEWGFCRREARPTDDLATCEAWSPTISVEQLRRKIR